MEIKIFAMLLIILCAVSTLFTEAIKQVYKNANKKYSANLIALVVALVVGGGGAASAYCILAIPFTTVNIILIVFMIFAIWIGAMLGYDKVIQLFEQIRNTK